MALEIVGKKSDVDRYKKQRGILELDGFELDPHTGQQVIYAGLKRLGAQGVNADVLTALENNPWVKHGPDFRLGHGSIAPKGTMEYASKKEFGGLYLRDLSEEKRIKSFDMERRLEIIGVANANIVDRYDERVSPAGGDFTHFMKNRVLLLDHRYLVRDTVGRVQALSPESDGVKFDAFVGDAEAVGGSQFLTASQRESMSLIGQRLVQTVSIGFIAKKIRAPLYNDQGVMEEPAVIELWELLEISIVAVPANPGAVFQAKAMAKSFYKMLGQSSAKHYTLLTTGVGDGKNGTKGIDLSENEDVQTLIFSREKFTRDEAIKWIGDNGFKVGIIEESTDSYTFAQRDTSDFEAETLRRLIVDGGVEAVIGLVKEDKSIMTDEQAKALIDGVTALGETMKQVATGITDLKGQNEKILGSIGGDKPNDPPTESDGEKRLKAVEDAIASHKSTLDQINVILGGLATKLGLKAA